MPRKCYCLSIYTYFLEDCEADETDELPAKRPARDDDKDPNKLWGCLSEIISESSSSTPEKETEIWEINQYISAPLLDFKHGNALQWWQSNFENFLYWPRSQENIYQLHQQVCFQNTYFLVQGSFMMTKDPGLRHNWLSHYYQL